MGHFRDDLAHDSSCVLCFGHFRYDLAHDSSCTLCFGLMLFCIYPVFFFLYLHLRLGILTWQLWVTVRRARRFPEMYTK